MIEKKLIVNELLISYGESGDNGPAVLLLHGWGDSSKTFESLAKVLSKDYRVLAIDLPGFGASDNPPGVWGLSDYAKIVGAFADKLKLQLYCVIGHSNGGAIAIRALSSKTLKSDRLVLLASSGVRDVYRGKKTILRVVAKTAKLVTYPLPKKTKDKLKRRAYAQIGSDLFVAEHLQETFKKVVTDDVRKDAATLTIPTLLMYGTEDTATPPEFGKQFAQAINGAWLEVVPGAGHFIHHDASTTVESLIEKFLS